MSEIAVLVPTNQFLSLVNFLKESGSSRDPVEVVSNAIDYWMDNASWKKQDLMPEVFVDAEARGYNWKEVFLPSGTLVRLKYEGSFFYSRVEGDHLIFREKQVSPNEFAAEVTGTARNAWRDLWIKRPADADYQLADSLRGNNATLGES